LQFQLALVFVWLPFFVLVQPINYTIDDAGVGQAKPVFAVDQPYVGALRGAQFQFE
jgi:hypothetical protein